MIRRVWLVALALVTVAAVSTCAPAAQADIYPYRWKSSSVLVYDASKYDVRKAVTAWNAGAASFKLVLTSSPCEPFCVTVRDGSTTTLGGPYGGKAYIDHDASTIRGCSAVVNADILDRVTQRKRRQVYVNAFAGHEVGHCVGLDHDTSGAPALMYWYQNGTVQAPTERDLAELDRQY